MPMRYNKRVIALITFVIMLFCFMLTITAKDLYTLDVYCKDDEPLVGVEFEIFRVADTDAYGNFVPTVDFKDYNVLLNSYSVAYTLEGLVRRDSLEPLDIAVTNGGGYAEFSSLETGFYLVLASKHTQNDRVYSFAPFTVSIENDIIVRAKFDSENVPEEDDTIERKVLKVWDDGENKDRPSEVTVCLLKDDEVFDTVVLSDKNNWRHTWKGLDPNAKWTVAEEKTDGYTVSISREGITFVIANKLSVPDEPDETTKPPESTDTPDTTPDDTTSDNNTSTEDSTSDTNYDTSVEDTTYSDNETTAETDIVEILPQTGQLWWPVPLLVAVGLSFVAVGIICLGGALKNEKR